MGLARPLVKRRNLLTLRIAQPLAVCVIVSIGDTRASLGQPLVTHRVFERAALAVNCPYPVAKNGETTEPSAAAAARMRQTRASSRGPVEHFHSEIVRIPLIFGHIGHYPTCEVTFRSRRLLKCHGRAAHLAVFQRRFAPDRDGVR